MAKQQWERDLWKWEIAWVAVVIAVVLFLPFFWVSEHLKRAPKR